MELLEARAEAAEQRVAELEAVSAAASQIMVFHGFSYKDDLREPIAWANEFEALSSALAALYVRRVAALSDSRGRVDAMSAVAHHTDFTPNKSGTGVSEMAAESLHRNQGGKAHTRIRAAHL